MTNNNPIGLFDSGIGGTSIWSAVHHLLPNESTIYLADSKNAPYGQKSQEEIIALCIKNVDLLLEMKCKLIIVACNTATTNAIQVLRAKYDIPIIGIEPAIKPAVLHSKTNTIGILATKGTINSVLFSKAIESYSNTKIIEQIGYGLVELIENGNIDSIEVDKLLNEYITPMLKENIDCLVLGCSHYPYLIPKIKKLLPSHIEIIDSGEAVAKQTQVILKEKTGFNTSENSSYVFYTNTNPRVLDEILDHKYIVIEKKF